MKSSFLFLLLLISPSALAAAPFQGTFCGRGTVVITQDGDVQKLAGVKTLSLSLTENSLDLLTDKVNFDDGGTLTGRSEHSEVSNGQILYQGKSVGTVSDTEIHVDAVIAGYRIQYAIHSLGEGKISYERTSENAGAGVRVESAFDELTSGACP
ncbi:MAG: hypothetical protein ACXWPM_12370 [Bdellovibrionota bacterium]